MPDIEIITRRFGRLTFRGCEKHPNGDNPTCAKVRIVETGDALTSVQLWQVLKELAATSLDHKSNLK